MRSFAPDLITVGERDREDLGDVDALAASITSVGLLHPVVVTADGRLVAGGRRLAASLCRDQHGVWIDPQAVRDSGAA